MSKYTPFTPGERFGRLVTIADIPGCAAEKRPRAMLCRCDCGTERIVARPALVRGKTRSCGCYNREKAGSNLRTHGMSKWHPAYIVWMGIRSRCENPSSEQYPNYGGRGVKVCPQWRDFTVFLADVGPRPSLKHSLNRIDNDGNYEPGNVEWATQLQQCRNKRDNRWITFEGRTMVITDWGKELGLTPSLIAQRIKDGWPLEKALSPILFARSGLPLSEATLERIRNAAKQRSG